ncbi:MAG: hypothetical protein LBH13_06685 [Cellulomonadaceae bacterium]|jgi:hypothetical protein|nr:hypothetical protein [Cellulomonadaceae bacterium]
MGLTKDGSLKIPPNDPTFLIANTKALSTEGYPLDAEGRFGTRTSKAASELIVDDPIKVAEAFYRKLGQRGVSEEIETKYGTIEMAVFSDDSRVVLRRNTKSSAQRGTDNPAVELQVRLAGTEFPRNYKLHFRKEGE